MAMACGAIVTVIGACLESWEPQPAESEMSKKDKLTNVLFFKSDLEKRRMGLGGANYLSQTGKKVTTICGEFDGAGS
jgi:hypothetical protein